MLIYPSFLFGIRGNMFETTVDVGLVLLLAVIIAEYMRIRSKFRGFNWLTMAGILLIFTGTFGAASVLADYVGAEVWKGLQDIFGVLGWLFALVGTVFIVYEMIR